MVNCYCHPLKRRRKRMSTTNSQNHADEKWVRKLWHGFNRITYNENDRSRVKNKFNLRSILLFTECTEKNYFLTWRRPRKLLRATGSCPWGYWYLQSSTLHIRVEWFSTFFEFWNVHLTVDQVYFWEFNSKNRKSFHIKKLQGPYKLRN